MAWTDPITWAFKTTILSASLLNQQIRDNLNYLKAKPTVVVELGTTDQTGITTSWVKVTGSDLVIDVDGNVTLEFAGHMHIRSTTAEARVAYDIWDVDNNVYLSSGTGTPATRGLSQVNIATANQGHSLIFRHLQTNIPDGVHNYEVRVLSSAAATTIDNATCRNQVSVREV